MDKPLLLVIAGCNGSGKSSFASALTPAKTSSFDYDKEYLNIYNSLSDSELRDTISHNQTRTILETKIEQAIHDKANFCYETNFNSSPLFWPTRFKKAGYRLEIAYFCLDSIDTAKTRVRIRVENG